LKTERNCAHNSALKYLAYFKKIVRIAYANGWLDKNPFFNFKSKRKVVEREFLTSQELQVMLEKEFSIPRITHVRDVFIFCCFTGLAYSDVLKLTHRDIVIGIDGKKWIKTKRTKTKTLSSIPLLPIAWEILDKYKNEDHLRNKGRVLPVYTNQRMNSYLKEIADVCGIQKRMTFHLARHTFAATVTLSNGVPIESVSKMLGHRSLKTTQHYAKIVDKKLSEDMNMLKDRLLFDDFVKVGNK
jgi:site-specific recombinase XerD